LAYSDSDGNRLNLNWVEGTLNCDNWNWDEDRNSNVGAFPLMM
jgi:hypothetical protein